MKSFLKSRFFWTKQLPVAYFVITALIIMYHPTTLKIISNIPLIFFLLWNLFLRKRWMSCIFGIFYFLIAVYDIFSLISSYFRLETNREFYNKNNIEVLSSSEALQLLTVRLLICCLSMLMSILLCLPYKQKHPETSFNK
jgi:hypothetical protein